MNKRKNRFRFPTLIIMLLSTVLALGTTSLVVPSADASGSAGGGGNIDNGGAAQWWTTGSWSEFVARSGRADPSYAVKAAGENFPNGGDKLLADCQNSKWIAYYGSYSEWTRYGKGTNNLPKQNLKDVLAESAYNSWLSWGSSMWNTGEVTIICSASFEEQERTLDFLEYRDTSATNTFLGVVESKTSGSFLVRQEYAQYTSAEKKQWQDNVGGVLTTGSEKSRYGIWLDANRARIASLASLTGEDYTNLLAQLQAEAAEAQSGDYIAHPMLNITTGYRSQFSDGGVIEIAEQWRYERQTISTTGREVRTRHEKQKMVDNKWVTIETTYSDWTTDIAGTSGAVGDAQLGMFIPSTWLQMIHAKCNETGMTAASNAVPGNSSDSSLNTSASETFRTPKYYSQGQVPLGQSSGREEALTDTSKESFYDETSGCLVYIDCVTDPVSGAENDSKNNVQANGNLRDGTYGAQSEVTDANNNKTELSSDSFTFFRDNEKNSIRFDYWYPRVTDVNSGITVDEKAKALRTRMFMDPLGTPLDDMINVYVNNEVEFDTEAISNGIGYNKAGEVNTIEAAASWASNDNAAHKINIDWMTEPIVKNQIMTSVNAVGDASGLATDESKIRAFCSMRMNQTDNNDPTLSQDVVNDVGALTSFDSEANHYTAFNFIRSGSGLNE